MVASAVFFALTGALVGTRYRAPALIPATLVAVIWAVATGYIAGLPSESIALLVALLVVVLQAAYLLTLALRTLIRLRPNGAGSGLSSRASLDPYDQKEEDGKFRDSPAVPLRSSPEFVPEVAVHGRPAGNRAV